MFYVILYGLAKNSNVHYLLYSFIHVFTHNSITKYYCHTFIATPFGTDVQKNL